ncbi:MAG: PLP-dependent cysteine synthase family protein [Elusimicrobia bacterium]|nr:PLP-dependent cysteine synthase family protein [Elusimicrobiota bacterium]
MAVLDRAAIPTVLDLGIGNTPLLRISRPDLPGSVEVHAKAEWVNPGGSVKDRPAARMVLAALASGAFRPTMTLLDSTSGNTGIAYAWLGAKLGFPVRLAVPASIGAERRRILEAYGARLDLTDPLEGSDGAMHEARRILKEDPAAYFYPNQYDNPENWRAHYDTTGPEVLEQTAGLVTHFVAGLGTTGTFRGTAARLKEARPGLRAVSVQPDSPLHGLEGLKHLATAAVPGIHDPALADAELTVSTDEARAAAREAARADGLLLGPSGGANLAAALRVARAEAEAGRAAVVVTVFPDSGERYLGERWWREG